MQDHLGRPMVAVTGIGAVTPLGFGVAESWSALLARSVQAARLRSEIRSLPRVADRLDAWLGEGNALPERGHWQDVAAELGITREALYRELSRRRTKPLVQSRG